MEHSTPLLLPGNPGRIRELVLADGIPFVLLLEMTASAMIPLLFLVTISLD